MEHLSIVYLSILVLLLISLGAFFSAAEISMMAINRYRLNHLVNEKNRLAILVHKLLKRPDRVLGVALLGNTFAAIAASSITTLIISHLFGEIGVAVATIVLSFFVLIVSEVTPKILAASRPQPVAFLCVIPLTLFSKLLSPVVWSVNIIAHALLQLIGIKVRHAHIDHLSGAELRTVVEQAGQLIPHEHRNMLLSIFDLEDVTVNDIMIPRNEIIGIDLDEEWEVIKQQLQDSEHTRLPLYRKEIDNIVGILHLRSALSLIDAEITSSEILLQVAQPVYFVPENTPLNKQLLHFRKLKSRIGLVVNEYGDIEGLVTLEDILEEIVGEFTTTTGDSLPLTHLQSDGTYLVDGGATIRELNRELNWDFPTEGPKTLSGLIIEYLEYIPTPATCLRIANYPIEIIKVQDNTIKTVIISPRS